MDSAVATFRRDLGREMDLLASNRPARQNPPFFLYYCDLKRRLDQGKRRDCGAQARTQAGGGRRHEDPDGAAGRVNALSRELCAMDSISALTHE